MRIFKKLTIVSILLLLFTGCAESNDQILVETKDDLNGLSIALTTGSCYEPVVKEQFPDSEIFFYDASTRYDAVSSGKAFATVCEYPSALSAVAERDNLAIMNTPITQFDDAFAFRMGESEYYEDFNSFLIELRDNGTLEELRNKWVIERSTENIDIDKLTGENGTLRVSTISNNMPYAFYSNNQLTGLEIDILYRYGLSRGYNYEFLELDITGCLAAIGSGTCDFSGGALTVTEERKKTINYTIPYYSDNVIAVVRKENLIEASDSFDALKSKTVSCIAASVYIPMVLENVEDVNIASFSTLSDCISSVKSGKAEALACNLNVAQNIISETEGLEILGEIGYEEIGIITAKNDTGTKYKNQFDAFQNEYKENGKLQELRNKYNDVEKADLQEYNLTGVNGTLTICIDSTAGAPYDYVKNGKLIGYEVELFMAFAEEYGYALDFLETDFSGVLAGVSSGKAAFGAASVTITSERKESMNFTEPVDSTPAVLVGKTSTENKDSSFIDNFKDNFYRTFIKEDRWMMFLKGVGSTMLISVASIILGTVLGFTMYLLFRTNLKLVDLLLRFYTWLIKGMPTVVFLMILFYVVFGKSALNGTVISIIGFTVLFSITIFGLLKQCFDAIDRGQFEASYALGYTKTDTLFRIILPQTMPMFLPSFKSEVVSLIKATSIVGYIAVQDLTKMSDLVRSRTYEAFFPLIGATVLYFAIAGVFNISIKMLMKATDPKRRSKDKILKGVNTK